MKPTSRLTVLLFCSLGCNLASAQVTIRDHRGNKETKYVPRPFRPRPTAPTTTDLEPIPQTISTYRVDPQFRDEISFSGNGLGPLQNSPYKVFFSNKLVLNNGSIVSLATEAPKEMMFYTDTLFINGNFHIDWSKNLNNTGNGFLFISCRVLKLTPGAQLKVDLTHASQYHFRKFFFFAEQVFSGNRKVYDEAKEISNTIRVQSYCNGHWERLRVGETAKPLDRECNFPGYQPRPGYKFVTQKYDPLVAAVGFLPVMSETHADFFNFFSKWVAASYQNLYDKIIRDVTRIDKIPVVKHFIKFLALNNYNQLEAVSQAKAGQLIVQINQYKEQIFKNGYQFERTLNVEGKPYLLVGSVTENNIVNYVPPTLSLVNTSLVNQRTISGYTVFDETQPDKTTIDFDVFLYTDSRLREKIQGALQSANETLSNSFEEIRFLNLLVEGPDVVPALSKVHALSNNGFNIRLVVNNTSAILFNRLFSSLSSDIYLTGKWTSKAGDIGGDLKIPIGFSRVFNPNIEALGGSLVNKTAVPVTVEFYKKGDRVESPATGLQIDPGASFPGVYSGDDKQITILPDGVTFRMNPEKFGDYFEQIDNSDKLIQELFIENHIANFPVDSLSGSLQFVQVTARYTLGQKIVERKLQLAPADALGSSYNLLIPKSNKDPIAITIQGKAVYQNGEYDIVPVGLSNGEAEFNLEVKHLKGVKL